MVTADDFGTYKTSWCPGCGNFGIIAAVKQALAEEGIAPNEALVVSGIGQAAKLPHYMRVNFFNGLHGRALPVAQGARLANRRLKILVTSGDGCTYGEGGNHFLAAIRRNMDLTVIVHDNQIYGLTKGQASPTTMSEQVTKAQPWGVASEAFNPVAVAVAMNAGFVARGFSGMQAHLADLIRQAMNHEGFALVDVLQPCVSFNKVNTQAWYRERCYELPPEHDPTDRTAAMARAWEFGERIPIGVLYRTDRPTFESRFRHLEGPPLAEREEDRAALERIMMHYA
ncbi:2-oxoglutarate ferredoxin oxidoreductase subunit beta [Desulfobaculum xiamenense]|uniref:2-oxoglutarate ferredoxin oxidoreductase subunit beta n=1 Tax=Desulfobaculum xiamenense TaxID=995050 RepID=A0A846QF35_9BACT|nr:thiamine pyrophosphate-dependent enzyme [Desulfobaculum xiamenense]NJB66948.1 2-oxoglutarate ferredoxin oxidoreductase subunit beta [Desulfobaculum xiamenense]